MTFDEKKLYLSTFEKWVFSFEKNLKEICEYLGVDKKSIKQAIDIGSGEGASTKAIVSVFPMANVIALDPVVSPKDFGNSRVTHIKASLQEYLKNDQSQFDLVVVAHVDGLMARDIEKLVSSGGYLIEINCSLNLSNLPNNMKLVLDEGVISGEVRVWKKQ